MGKVITLHPLLDSPIIKPPVPRIYLGWRDDAEAAGSEHVYVVRVAPGAAPKAVPLPHKEYRHADSFSWGYNGSGPAELARCLLIDHFGGPMPAPWLYHDFKETVLAWLPEDATPWSMTSDFITGWLTKKLQGVPSQSLFERPS